MKKKFIEEFFPINEISAIGSKEKSTPADNISGIHIWWARRPTSVCRAIILSCLFDYPSSKEEREAIKSFIIQACSDYKKLPNLMTFKRSLNKLVIKNNQEKYILLDTFSGGSAIPLEAARLGLTSYGSDLNPVAVLIGKATCEYLQKYKNSLIESLEKYWLILRKTLLSEIGIYYKNRNKNIILAYIWARQVKCVDTSCNALIPMLQDLKLVNKKNERIVLKPIIVRDSKIKAIKFKIQRNNEIDFDYNNSKIFLGGKITCPACGTTIGNSETMELVKQKKYSDKLIVVVEKEKNSNQKRYRLATEYDNKLYSELLKVLENYKDEIPNEELPEKVILWAVQNYGILKWKELFNERQLLFYILFSKRLRELYPQIKKEIEDSNLSKAIMLFLSFILTRSLTHNSKFTHWYVSDQLISQTWSRIGLFMKGNYPEHNPFSDFSGTPNRYIKYIKKIQQNNLNFSNTAEIKQGNAMQLDLKGGSVDIIVTDPPYYDAMLYANPSDFFYIWLKKCLIDVFPELFLFNLTPKEEEIIQSRYRHKGNDKAAKLFYENSLKKVLNEFYKVLKPTGIGVIIFTHKSVDAWEVLLNAVINANLTISAAWPIETETKGGIRSLNKVVLASSIAIIFKKIEKIEEIYFETMFANILENELNKKLKNLLIDLEIYGADFFISAIGFSLNILTRYKYVISQKTGEQVSVSAFLDLVRKIVNNFLLSTVLEKNITQNIDDITNLYIIWCWFFRNNGIALDDALKLAQSFGVGELNDLRKEKIIKLENKKFKLLIASDEVREDFLMKNRNNLSTYIDNLHLLAILWKNNDKTLDEEVKRIESKYGDHIWKVGQALAEFFPKNHKEHNYLQGLLARYGKSKSKGDIKKWL